MKTILQKYASVKSLLILFAGVIVVNIIFANAFGSHIEPLDLQFSYSSDKAYELLDRFSEEELNRYFWLELTVDMIYPVIYMLFFSFALYLLFKNVTISKLPITVATFDILENICIITLIKNLPNQLHSLVPVSSFFTSTKWILTAIVVGFILYGIVRKVAGRFIN